MESFKSAILDLCVGYARLATGDGRKGDESSLKKISCVNYDY